MRTTLLSLFFAALIGVPAFGQAQPLPYLDQLPPIVDRDLFFGDPEIAGPQLSPDGEWMTFLRPHLGVRNIWIKGIDEPFESARPITADTTRPVGGYFWSRDSQYVLYVQDRGGDENFHVHVVDPRAETGPAGVPEARNVTPYDGARAQILSRPKDTPLEIIVGLNDRDARWHDVYRVNLETGERELIRENTEEVAGWSFDLDGNLRLAARTLDDGATQIYRVDDDQLEPVYVCSVFETCGPMRFHRDGERVYFVTNRGTGVDLIRLTLFNPETGEEELVEQDPDGEVDFGGAEFSNVTDEIEATYYIGDKVRIYPHSDRVSRAVDIIRSRFAESEFSFGSATADDRLQLVRIYSDTDPGSTYLMNHETGDLELVFQLRPELPSEHLNEMRPIRYAARDGVEIPAYLTLPRGVEERDLALVVFPHGGPWARDIWGYHSWAQFMANRGYAVLMPNFRGSTGFGKEFLNLGNAEWGTGYMQHDITDGVQYLVDQGMVDPERVGIMGISYGGYATLAGLTYTPDLYAAGVSIVGPSNLITLLNTIPPYWAAVRNVFNVRMGDPDDPEDAARLREQSPFFHADQIRAPLLVVQGANDPRVRQSESDQIVVAARDNEVAVEYMVAPDEGHGFAGLANRMAMMVAIERFLSEYLGGRLQDEVAPDLEAHLQGLMVDVDTVELPEIASAGEPSAELPAMDGSRLSERTLRYHTRMEVGGQHLDLEVQRAIAPAEHNGRQVWRAIEYFSMPAQLGGMTSVDTFDVDRSTLMPVRRHAQSMASMEFTYHDDRIVGEMRGGGQTIPANIDLEAPVLGDGPGLDMALAGMNLEPGFESVIRIFNPAERTVRAFRMNVAGEEAVEVHAGQFAAYRVEMTPIDGNGGAMVIHVMADAPYLVVRSEQQLPAAMGGGTMTSELEWMEPGPME
jgi:dipeptidyl aminopeptidase/acylaminoacyl peptidase